MTSPVSELGRPRKLTMAKLTELLFESAVTSAINAFLILLMGRVALAIVGTLFQSMWPALPRGMGHGSAFKVGVSAANAWAFWNQELFFILFSILFALSLLLGLARHSSPETARLAGRLRRLGRRFNDEWFGLIVGNAFGALIAASVLTWVQQFSVTRMVCTWLASAVAIAAHSVGARAFGDNVADAVNNWFSWYAGNQFKFTFWVTYVAIVCDDLGLPNLKTMARLVWRKLSSRKHHRVENPEAPGRSGPAIAPKHSNQ